MEKKLSEKKLLWLRIQEKLLYGDSYSSLSPCARNVLFLAALKCCENYREFNTNYYHIVLHALQFFLGGYVALNTMSKTNFSRQNYRTALRELETGRWAIIERMVPVLNTKTGQITKKNNLGVIIDMSCILTSENKEEIDFNHSPAGVVISGQTGLIEPDVAPLFEEAANHLANQRPTRGGTTGGDAGTPMDTEKINGQSFGGNYRPNHGGTTLVTNLIKPDVAFPFEEAANHPADQLPTRGGTTGGDAGTPMDTEKINGQNPGGNHRPNHGGTTLVTDKCCCRYDELKATVVPTDEEGYPLCPYCGKPLEKNLKKQFYFHPDWKSGQCQHTFSAKALKINWETKRKNEQQQQQHERSTKFAAEEYTKNLSQRAAASHCLMAIKALLPNNDVDKIRQQQLTENETRTNYEELKIRKRN